MNSMSLPRTHALPLGKAASAAGILSLSLLLLGLLPGPA